MRRQEPQQFHSGITGSTDDAYFDHHKRSEKFLVNRAEFADGPAPVFRNILTPTGKKAAMRRLLYRFALCSLENCAPARLVQADLLALHFARIASNQPGLAQHRSQRRIVFDQRPGNAMTHRPGLARFSAALDVDPDVERLFGVGELQGLAHDHAAGFPEKEPSTGLPLTMKLPLPDLINHPRYRAFAPAGAIVIVSRSCYALISNCRGCWAA